jgi:hypothetical protein
MTEHVRYPELVAVQVEEEQQWCYARRMEHIGPRRIAELSPLPLERGGIGRRLSAATVRKRIDDYVAEHHAEHVDQRDMLIAQELEDLDAQYRETQRMTEMIDRVATALNSYALTGHAMMPDEALRDAPETVVRRDERTILAAMAQLRQIGERRAKLLGLDAVTKTQVDVTVKDQASAELEAMLVEAGIERADR